MVQEQIEFVFKYLPLKKSGALNTFIRNADDHTHAHTAV